MNLNHRLTSNGFLFKEKEKEKNIRKDAIQKYGFTIKDMVRIKQGEDYIDPDGVKVDNRELTLPPFRPRSYAFCTDTAFAPSIVPVIKGVDILYHESTFTEEFQHRAKKTKHSTAKEAATIAQMAGVKRPQSHSESCRLPAGFLSIY